MNDSNSVIPIEEGIEAYKAYVSYHLKRPSSPFATCIIPNGDKINVGLWYYNLRQMYHKKKITKPTIDMYESLPLWSWDFCEPDKKSYLIRGAELYKQFITDNCEMPSPNANQGVFAIGKWLRDHHQAFCEDKLKMSTISFLALLPLPSWFWNKQVFLM